MFPHTGGAYVYMDLFRSPPRTSSTQEFHQKVVLLGHTRKMKLYLQIFFILYLSASLRQRIENSYRIPFIPSHLEQNNITIILGGEEKKISI